MSYYGNKKIWITGASSGIGREFAIQLSKKAGHLLLSARRKDALQSVADELEDEVRVNILPLDLGKHETLSARVEEAIGLLGHIDIIIHNGGISQRSLAAETQFSVYKKLIDVNYLGTVAINQFLLPHFISRNQGHMVVITSTAGKIGVPMRTGYSGAKHALHGYFEGLRAELNKTNIDITLIAPGFIKTDISMNALIGDGRAQQKMDDAQKNGMRVDLFVRKALSSVSNRKPEKSIGGFKDTTLAIIVWRLFPNLLRKIIAKSKVT